MGFLLDNYLTENDDTWEDLLDFVFDEACKDFPQF